MLIFMFLMFIKGTQKFPSIIGISPCSLMYWFIQFISIGIVILFAQKNLHTLKVW